MQALIIVFFGLLLTTVRAEVIYQPDTNINFATKQALFTSKEKLCILTFMLSFSSSEATLSLVNHKECEFTEARYTQALKQVLTKLKTVLPEVEITHFQAGEGSPHPLTFSALEKIAKASINDPYFKRIQKEGERTITLNRTFQKLASKTNAFDHFINLHKSAGLPLAYERSEKILRKKNERGQRIISGAGLIIFRVHRKQ